MKCTCTDLACATRAKDEPCPNEAKFRLTDEDGEAFLCNRHARAVRDMYEPGQIRKLRTATETGSEGR